MENYLLEELLTKYTEVYFFGAGIVAQRIYNYICNKKIALKVRAFLVSGRDFVPEELFGVPVKRLSENLDKSIPVMVTVSEVYNPEVYSLLRKEGYADVISVFEFNSVDLPREETDDIVDVDKHITNIKLTPEN